MSVSKIEYPGQRQELLSYLGVLSDRAYQAREWVSDPSEIMFYSSILPAIHFFFDDLGLMDAESEKADFLVPWVLYNEVESTAVKKFARTFDRVLTAIGDEKPDSAYIDSPLWNDVLLGAKEALDVLMVKGDGRSEDDA